MIIVFIILIGLTRSENRDKIGLRKEHHYRSFEARIVMPFKLGDLDRLSRPEN